MIQMDRALIAQIEAFARSTQVSRTWIVRAVLSGWLADKKLRARSAMINELVIRRAHRGRNASRSAAIRRQLVLGD